MSDYAIKIENLSKQYRLGVVGTGTLSHDLKRWWATNILGKEDPYLKIGETNVRESSGGSEYVWALRDINLEVKQGEILGIIGKNGAGKSTLLKLLSRVTKPTTGTITYKGRIASLLEVGTGFHPEMTGRENIYMNGTIMGMTRAEIHRQLDAIIDFAGVARYIDTPVKRYSSGMTVRLGFAIAAHLEPEILVVDEVLAVGDAEFQKKAIGKMQDVSKGEGRTVLFVSHNMAAVKSLCNSGVIISDGNIILANKNINHVVDSYISDFVSSPKAERLSAIIERKGNKTALLTEIEFLNSQNSNLTQVGKPFGLKLSYNVFSSNHSFHLLLSINTVDNICVLFLDSRTANNLSQVLYSEGYFKICLSEDFSLAPGRYYINAALFINDSLADYVQQALVFDVSDGLFFKNGKMPIGKSLCLIKQEWGSFPK